MPKNVVCFNKCMLCFSGIVPDLKKLVPDLQSERENKVCDLRSGWFVTLSYRRRAVERSGSTGPTTLSHLALRAGSSTTMMACDEPARVNNFGHFQTF